VDFSVNERLAALDLVGIHELFPETVAALDRLLGVEGMLIELNKKMPYLEAGITTKARKAHHTKCVTETQPLTYNVFTQSVGHAITESDACLYNEFSVFELIQLRKMMASTVRVYDKWRKMLGAVTESVGRAGAEAYEVARDDAQKHKSHALRAALRVGLRD